MLVIYSKDGCSACDSAKMMLTNIGVDFSVVNTSEDFDAFEFILSLSQGSHRLLHAGSSSHWPGK